VSTFIVGVIVAVIVALVLFGGIKRIGQVTEKLVPFMAVIYIVAALIVIFANIGHICKVFAMIFEGAFNADAAIGGAFGITVLTSMKKGVGRGCFSNEAGLGSAPIAHAASSEKNPVKQGVYGIFEVFMDTIVICTLTALVALCSGAADGQWGVKEAASASTTIAGFSTVFGAKFGSTFLALALLLFATSTILGWALYGSRCMEYLFGTKVLLPYQLAFVVVIVIGATADLKLVWDISDTLNGLMAFPNLIGLLLLSPVVIKMTKEFFSKKEE
jgi:AGCS family alanine or glycine:cation symporter